jgi:nitroreductase
VEHDQTVRSRRSVRAFQNRDVAEATLQQILDLARHAPSSMNGQPWHFVVVREPATKRRIAAIKNRYCPIEKAEFRADFLEHAPVVVVVCVDRARSYERAVENAVLATGHILLAASARGLGSVYMSAFRSADPRVAREFRGLLGIPADVDPVTLVPLGYPAEAAGEKSLRPLQEMVHHEAFDPQRR